MFIFSNMIKRFCHQHSRNIIPMIKKSNPLVECEKKYMKPFINNNQKSIYLITPSGKKNETNVIISYIDKQNKFCKIDINILL